MTVPQLEAALQEAAHGLWEQIEHHELHAFATALLPKLQPYLAVRFGEKKVRPVFPIPPDSEDAT